MKEGLLTITEPKMNALITGLPGSGKTYFMSTFPKMYMIVTERRLHAVALSPLASTMYCVYIETWEELDQVINEILQGKRATGYESVGIDSLTEMTPLVVDYVQRLEKRPPTVMTQPMWGLAISYLRKACRQFSREIGQRFHTVMSARVITEKDDVTGMIMGKPATIGKFADDVGGFFDCTFHLEQLMEGTKPVWKIHTKNISWFRAKDSLGGFLAPIEVGGFADLWKKIQAGVNQRKTASGQTK